jgi:Xaa-Pro dipeptidase
VGDSEGIIFLQGTKESDRYDTDMRQPFRQESNFLYLTGANEPDFHLAIRVKDGLSILFVPFRDDYYALWNGIVETPEEIKEKYGVSQVYVVNQTQLTFYRIYNDDLESEMTKLTDNKTHTVYILKGASFPGINQFTVNNTSLLEVLIQARIVKTKDELKLLRVAFDVSK